MSWFALTLHSTSWGQSALAQLGYLMLSPQAIEPLCLEEKLWSQGTLARGPASGA